MKKTLSILLVALAVTFFLTSAMRFKTTASPYLPVHNITTGLDYPSIQEAVNAPETLDGHIIMVDSGTYYENVFVNKTLSFMGENKLDTVIDGNGSGTVFTLTAEDISITGFTIRNVGARGIYSFRSSGSNISNNIFSNTSYGIWLSGSGDNLITGNDIPQAKHVGIIISDCSTITLSNNNVTNNEFGIALIGSSSSTLRGNNLSSSSKDGIYFFSSDSNIIQNNAVFSCNESGIWLSQSTGNLITENNVSQNHPDGIHMENSNSNTILHNNLVNNTLQLVSINSTSSLDNGIEGNYWSDYNGTDQDQDGIGNTPYVIDGNNIDNHPLMGTFSEFTITREKQAYYVNTISNSTISNFNFSLTEYTVRFNVNSPVNASGFCRITIPEILIMGPYVTLIDNKKVNATLLMISNATQTFMYFTYAPDTHEVTISSEPFYQLLEKYDNLFAAYQNLTSTYNQLFGNYTTLQGINDALSRQYESLNSTYQNLSDSYNELESKYSTASNEIANITKQIPIFTVATIMETIAVLALISLGIRYNNMLSKQKKEIEAYKRQLEKVSHLEGARVRFAEDVRRRKAKIEQFEKKYHVIIRPPSTLEEIFESMKLKEKTSKEA